MRSNGDIDRTTCNINASRLGSVPKRAGGHLRTALAATAALLSPTCSRRNKNWRFRLLTSIVSRSTISIFLNPDKTRICPCAVTTHAQQDRAKDEEVHGRVAISGSIHLEQLTADTAGANNQHTRVRNCRATMPPQDKCTVILCLRAHQNARSQMQRKQPRDHRGATHKPARNRRTQHQENMSIHLVV